MSATPEARHALSDRDRVAWLRLIRTDGIGPITFISLLARFGTADAALEALPELIRRGGTRPAPRIPPREAAEREIEAAGRLGARLVALCEDSYPEPLANIPDPPPILAVRGDAALLHGPIVGMVGARNASANGRRLARTLAQDLSTAGYVVASGMARGIDAAAQDGCHGCRTIAVVAGGIDVVYPRENQELYDRIVAGGCVVSEMPIGAEPQARHFPRRNRIVSGLSRGVLVIEAARRSGSLITARMALEQGREVFAVPGSPLDPRCHGTNNLIRQGAVLTETAQDVLDVLGEAPAPTVWQAAPTGFTPPANSQPGPPLPSNSDLVSVRTQILDLLSPSPIPVDELIRECQVSVPDAHAVLLELELAGRISRSAGNQVALVAVEEQIT